MSSPPPVSSRSPSPLLTGAIAPPTDDSRPKQFCAFGAVYQVQLLNKGGGSPPERDRSCFEIFCCCFTRATPKDPIEKAILDRGETEKLFKKDFPFMADLQGTKNPRGFLVAASLQETFVVQASQVRAATERALSPNEEAKPLLTPGAYQFSLLRGDQLGNTYAIIAPTDSLEGRDWRAVDRYEIYHCKDAFDRKGKPLPLETIQKRVERAISTFKDQGFWVIGPLDGYQDFIKCDDYDRRRF